MTYRHTCDRPCDVRGQAVRRVLLEVIRRCEAGGLLLPQYAVLGRSLGIDRSQVSRHLKRLRAEGAYVELPARHWRRHVTTIRNAHLRDQHLRDAA
jgi:DNA-binding MarR family transcriptional regulator